MCFDVISRNDFLKLGATVAMTGAAVGLPGLAVGAEAPPASSGPGGSDVNFKWLGTNGWEIAFGNRRILMDPWFGRFDSGFFRPGHFNPQTPLTTNSDVLDREISGADYILIGHGHWDHIADVPYIQKKTGAAVIGTETHANSLLAAGVPAAKLIRAKGGEYMQFDGFTIEVFPGLHSLGPTKQYSVPGHYITPPPAPPSKVADLPEGDTLIYQITIGEKFRIFAMSTANFVERAIAGLKPDVALVAAIFANQIHDYNRRLLAALNHPKVILPTHWDNFEKPFSQPPQDLRDVFGDPGNIDHWIADLKVASPASKVVMLKFFESYAA